MTYFGQRGERPGPLVVAARKVGERQTAASPESGFKAAREKKAGRREGGLPP